MLGDMTAASTYGGRAARQPTASATPTHAGEPEPMARTIPRASGLAGDPTLLLVALLGVAFFLIRFGVRVGFSAEVSA